MLRFAFVSLLFISLLALIGAGTVLWYIVPQLPSVESLRDVQLQTPLRVFSADDKLIAEFGEKRRLPVDIAGVPPLLKQAFLAAEDDRFYHHPGVDWIAIARAAVELIHSGEKKQGGSTITMQVARNFFLSPEKTYERKLKEIALAVIIERDLTKDEILELYLNKIFLGHRSYGVGAAARVYYGVALEELDLPQIATIAGLPKAPSRTNPISNPAAAIERRNYVLGRMLKLGYIDAAQYETAKAAPNSAKWHGQAVELSAPNVAEMVRDDMVDRYGEAAYTSGYRVVTTVDSRLQDEATLALREGLRAYDRRHGYRGPERRIELATAADETAWQAALEGMIVIAGLQPALITAVDEKHATAWTQAGTVTIPFAGIKWARKYLGTDARGAAPQKPADVLAVGDVVRVRYREAGDGNTADAGYWSLEQLPAIEGALVAVDPDDGAILTLIGGIDFAHSKFNRVTQARRQPGSNFKPFIYAAALEKGFTAASFVNDAPIVFDAPGLETAWRPENYGGTYYGPTRLREALTHSRNLVSIRLLRAIGIEYALDYASRFGFDADHLPRNLSLALGSGEVTPLELVTGFAVLANGGYKISPYLIKRIEDAEHQQLVATQPATACRVCEEITLDEDGEPADLDTLLAMRELPPEVPAPRVIPAQNAWIMTSMLQDVISFGTGRRALALNRKDLAGKTGTTNDQKDAWFTGYNSRIATTAWVGFDNAQPLGRRETGGHAALPIWIDFMRAALTDMPESSMERPPGLVTVRIDPKTGLLAGANHPGAIFESFREGHVPPRGEDGSLRRTGPSQGGILPDQLF
ncbi:MAG: penicillin-binding protein 1A [Gammaproteobacteria bacterium]